MDEDESELAQSFDELVASQENYLGSVNYGSLDDDGGPIHDVLNPGLSNTSENPPSMASDMPGNFEEIEMEPVSKDGSPTFEMTSVRRRRIQSAKDASRGIEHILEDMPSRTVSRSHGARIAAGLLSTAAFGTISGRNRFVSISPDDADAADWENELSALDGNIDNDDLRDMPVNMTLKKKVRSKVKARETEEVEKSKTIGWFALWKFKMGIKWQHAKDDMYKFVTSGKLWNYHLKQIEGDFGTGVLSYFTFLRGIFLLSLPSFFLSFLFISVPQLFDRPPKDQCNFTGEAILTGANCLTDTIMYQGYYTNETINKTGNSYYNMPLAYLFATFGYFLFCLIWLVRATGLLFRDSYVVTKEDGSNFANKIFCSWDFGIMALNAAEIRHKTIATDLKEVLAEQMREEDHRSLCEKLEVVLLRIVSWSCYFGVLAGAVALIFFINKTFICEIKSNSAGHPILQVLALPVIVSAINLLLPYAIEWITYLEKYKYPRHRLYISVLRNFIFKMSILGVICAFWTSDNIASCDGNSNTATVECWETNLGQEIYRLIIIDFLFSLFFSTFCAEFLWNWLAKACGGEKPQFSIANNVMDLIYGQTLCWIGVYFSPLLAFMNMIKYFVLFYVKKISLMKNCRPATERWRASQSRTLFNAVQLVSFILSSAFLSYVIFNQMPSELCGPFRGQTRAYDVVVAMVTDLSQDPSSQWLATLLRIITDVWVLDAIVIAILVFVIFEKKKSQGLQILASNLEEQIALEGKDKALLLKWLQKVSTHDKNQAVPPNAADIHTTSNDNQTPAGEVLMTNGVYNDPDFDTIMDNTSL